MTTHRTALPGRTTPPDTTPATASTRSARRRRGVTAAVALTGLLVVGACAPGGNDRTSSTGDSGTLRMSTWGNDSRLKLTQQAVDAFTKANPSIKVTIENAEFGPYWDKLATTTAANDAPDVIQMDEAYIAAYGRRGALLDLNTVKSTLDLSAMDSKVLDTGKVDDTLVGTPVGTANFSVAVNPKVLEQAGLKMPDDKTWTWDDLANLSAQVTAKLGSQGVYGLDFFGTVPAELLVWTRQHGEEVWQTKGQTPVSSGTISSYFDYANKLISTKAVPQASVQVENSTAALNATLFAINKAAFHLLFHTQVQAFATASKTQMNLLRLPAQKAGDSAKMVNKASMYWSISSQSKNTDAAAKLINFLMTDPAATKILLTERGIPAIPAVQTEIAPLLTPQGKIALDFSKAIAPDLVTPPQVTPANASGFATQFNSIATDAIFGRSSPSDAATKTLSTIQSMS